MWERACSRRGRPIHHKTHSETTKQALFKRHFQMLHLFERLKCNSRQQYPTLKIAHENETLSRSRSAQRY